MEYFDLKSLREIVEPMVQVFSALIVSGVATSIAVQFLKLDWFPLHVSKFPRLTSLVVAIVASIVTIYISDVNVIFNGALDFVAFTLGTALLAAVTYKNILKGTTSKDSLPETDKTPNTVADSSY